MQDRVIYTVLGTLVIACWLALEITTGTIAETLTGWLSLAGLLVLLAFCIHTTAYLFRLRLPPKAGFICGIAGIAWILYSFLPGGSRILERQTTSNGEEIVLIQREGGEPYSVDFYFRPAGGHWTRYYYEHEDTRWPPGIRRIRLSSDEKTATIYRFIFPVATFDIDRGELTLKRSGLSSPSQWIMPSEWDPSLISPRVTDQQRPSKI